MQNRYVGDVGDFGKYGLLRWLTGVTSGDRLEKLPLGVVWYLNHPSSVEIQNGDGDKIAYLLATKENQRHFKICDDSLYDSLAKLVCRNRRNICAIHEGNILPGAVYYESSLIICSSMKPREKKEAVNSWLKGAREVTKGAKIVFLDPDNGINSTETRPSTGGSSKHLYLSDLDRLIGTEQSFVIYHHAPRTGAENRIASIKTYLETNLDRDVRVLKYHRGTPRYYFVGIKSGDNRTLENRIESFERCRPWCIDKGPSYKYPHFTFL